jgi:hypothetical protein
MGWRRDWFERNNCGLRNKEGNCDLGCSALQGGICRFPEDILDDLDVENDLEEILALIAMYDIDTEKTKQAKILKASRL